MEEFQTDEERLERYVFEALGEASMCWQYPFNGGVFDSGRAKKIGEELIEHIWELVDNYA